MARYAALSPMLPQSIVESEELQHVVNMDNYDEDQAIQDAIELSLGRDHKGGVNRIESGRERESSVSSSNNNNYRSSNNNNRSSEAAGRQSGGAQGKVNKQRTHKIGGNNGQTLIDPWLSAQVSSQESSDRLSEETRKANSSAHRRSSLSEQSRRTSFGRSRFDYELMTLMSTSVTASGLQRSETPKPKLTSPRKQVDDVIEVNCSDHDDVELECTQTWSRHGPKDKMVDNRTNIDENSMTKTRTVLSSPTSGSPSKRRLVRASALQPSVNVISSDEEGEPGARRLADMPIGGRNVSGTVLESSDEELDELSRDSGKNVLKQQVRRPRHTLPPVADDTIPRSFDIEPSLEITSTPPLGSSAKMPWSITDGPEQDIVLSTPVSKQRTLHYDMVLDSEDELADFEKSFEFSPTSRPNAHAKHLGLPLIASFGDSESKGSPRAAVSESRALFALSETTSNGLEEIFTTQPSIDDDKFNSGDLVESQEILKPRRSRLSPTHESHADRTSIRLTKPRPFVLDIPSDDDLYQNTSKVSNESDIVDTEEEHRKLRETLMFTDDPDEEKFSCTSEQTSKGKQVSTATFPIFDFARRWTSEEARETNAKEDDNEYNTIWKKRSGAEMKHGSSLFTGAEEDEEEDEPLEDSRARRRSTQTNLRSIRKRMRLTETDPDISVMESALKAAANHSRQQTVSRAPAPPARMETIDSFSTIFESQPVVTEVHSASGRFTSPVEEIEEIEDFSDDPRSQKSQMIKERKARRRYTGLKFARHDKPASALKVEADDTKERHNKDSPDRFWYQARQREPRADREREQSYDYDQDEGDISPTLSQSALDRCPICHKAIPVEELVAHVDAELLANEQKEREEMEKSDEAMALALDETYQTQDVVEISDSQPLLHGEPTLEDEQSLTSTTLARLKSRQDHAVSLDTPTRKVRHLSLDSPSSVSRLHNQEYQREASCVIFGETMLVKDDKASDVESCSSQDVFHIQPGQVMEESGSLSASEAYISKRPVSRKKGNDARKSSKSKGLAGGTVLMPFEVHDEILDDDLEDFLEMPEPASMLNRPFRTKGKEVQSKAGTSTSSRRKTSTKKSSKGTVNLDDSGEENPPVVEVKRGKTSKRSTKFKSTVLDSVLPESVRERRQQMLGKSRGQRNAGVVDDDDEIEIGRHRPTTEDFLNQDDDPLDSRLLDRRLTKGVGLGGVVGGIGAVPGSLALSKFTKNSTDKSKSKSGSEVKVTSISEANKTSKVGKNTLNPPAEGQVKTARPVRQGALADDEFFAAQAPFDDYEDPNYGMHSQEWWDAAQPGNCEQLGERGEPGFDGHVNEAGAAAEDDGYMSPLDDFVDLRKRRDDPTLAMYFAQFGEDALAAGSAGGESNGKGRGRGRSRARGGGSKGVSYGPGIGPMPTGGGQPALTVYSIPRAGSTPASRSSGKPATTANGSMAIRSKPTQAFVPGRGRGRGGKSNWRGKNAWAARARGRGRGRGRSS
ncbi:MAG: hypothetical protein J3Q66DRAFT_326072 [Benniella sp.]|nr:MAG: hypothetical protein J3Q66DRAFT_326072 [Benniella sp.]